MRKLTQEEVIERFVAKHGDRYDYSLVEYSGMVKKVKIVCPVHGVFEQTPVDHLASRGCFQCFGSVKYTNQTFVDAANKVHGFKYDYSKVDYEHPQKKVTILCKEHGEFHQVPNSHLSGNGCPKCGKNKTKYKLAYSREEFIEKSNLKHNGRYDYSLVEYNNTMGRVKIVCSEHGVFEQFAGHHLKGCGCPVCADIERGINDRRGFDSFAVEAAGLHENKYTYFRDSFTTMSSKTKILCKVHGVFEQTPAHHLNGTGCPECAVTRFKKHKYAWLYIIYSDSFVGFGVTNKLKNRLKTHDKNLKINGINYTVFGTVFGTGYFISEIETAIKNFFSDDIINTGIEGFKWEAIKPHRFIDLLNFVETYAKENRPEGRDVKLVYN